MTDNRMQLAPPVPARLWGDREPPWVPDTVGRRAKTAEAPWKPDPDPDFPDTVFDGGRIGDLRVMACAARGAKHRFEGAARQDAAMAVSAAGWALAAVADGVGSVPGSHFAAGGAVRAALGGLSRDIEVRGAGAFERGPALFKYLCGELEQFEGPKTTLTVGAVASAPDAEGNYGWWVARVGDSPAYVLSGGRLVALFDTEREDEFGTATAALPTLDLKAAYRERRGRLRPGEALVLVSDGIGDLLTTDLARAANHEGPIADDAIEYFALKWQREPDPVDFLRHTQTRRRTFDDDRSAAVFWTAPAPVPQPPTLRPGAALRSARRAFQDIELSAARFGDLEIRSAVSKGAAGRHERRSRLCLLSSGERLVVIAAAALDPTAPAPVDRWTRRLRETTEWLVESQALDWTAVVWSRALQSLAEETEFDPRNLATAILSIEPGPSGADYSLSVSEGLAVTLAGAGLSNDIAEHRQPESVYPDAQHGTEFHFYADRLAPDQTLLLTNGVDPAAIAKSEPRPGPLQALGLLQKPVGGDRLIATVWSEG
ncbi:protein phosphatase 2C domain-containing protein [Glycomyces sp. NPDC021274]|uniref:protein phosphatase 2C domain-containing protein n=1 Tax=Glycomyces sp. NPDC021274 TaxID=3155120 RepID=UPI0033E5C6AF